MTDWKTKARGVHLRANEQAGSLAEYDFVVADVGDKFTDNVQAAYDAHKPIMLFAPSMLSRAVVDMGPDVVDWKPNAQPIIKELDRYILSNGVKRVIHGIIIDASVTDNGEGKALSSWWIATYTDWLLNEIFKRYAIPVYLYQNKDPMRIANTDGVQLLISLMDEWGICTVSPAPVTDGYPVDTAKPVLPPNVDDGMVQWWLWLYKVATNEPWLWLYNGTKDALYKDLNFTDTDDTTTDDPGNEDDTTTEGTTDLSDHEMITAIYNMLKNFAR